MSAVDYLKNIIDNDILVNYPFRYCLSTDLKVPFTIHNIVARPNKIEDFVSLDELVSCNYLDKFEGIGISIQASKICAIDVDKCFSKKYDLSSADDRAKTILDMFKNDAYIEFSFSGKGLRILFVFDKIDNYTNKYYTKNSKTGCEFYQPNGSARYVTLTGKTICNNSLFLLKNNSVILYNFLDKYMLKTNVNTVKNDDNIFEETRSIEELLKEVRKLYIKDGILLNLWFDEEHYLFNQISQESDTDFKLLRYLYEHVTKDEEKLRQLFEMSPYFKTKDAKHIHKWTYGNYRYFKYMYKNLY